ncbi:MAG: hypothetical protein HY646_11995 [Acidobacteria bacterium]|nr:hypothetical protein [Acidobacteriota bacterium]
MYRLAPGVQWSVEARGLLVKGAGGKVQFLEYPEAAVWDLISRGYRFDKVVSMVSCIASIDQDAGRKLVAESLDKWVNSGLLVR